MENTQYAIVRIWNHGEGREAGYLRDFRSTDVETFESAEAAQRHADMVIGTDMPDADGYFHTVHPNVESPYWEVRKYNPRVKTPPVVGRKISGSM